MKGRNLVMRAYLRWIYTGGPSSRPALCGGALAGINMENMSHGIPAEMIVSSLSFNAVPLQHSASTYRGGPFMLDVNGWPMASITSSANLAKTPGL